MSLLLQVPAPAKKLVLKSKRVDQTTYSILLISVAIFLAFALLTHVGLFFPENTMNQINACRDKIAGYEQSGIYNSPEQFRLALSNCGSR